MKFIILSPARWQTWLLSWVCFIPALYLIGLVGFATYTRQLVVPPVELPPSLQNRGYKPESVAKQITSEMQALEVGADMTIPHEVITDVANSRLNIRVPGQDMTYQAIVDFLKSSIGRSDVAVLVDIVEESHSNLKARLRVDGGTFNQMESEVKAETRNENIDIDKFIKDIGNAAMRLSQPNVLASHLIKQKIEVEHCSGAKCRFEPVEKIYDEVAKSRALEPVAQALAGRTDLLNIQGRWTEAKALSEASMAQYGESATLHQIHAVALEGLGSIDAAVAELRKSVKLPSVTAETWRIFGDVLMHTGERDEYREALDAFAEADRLMPRFTDNLHDWGEALLQNGEIDEAIDKFTQAVKADPGHVPSYIEWGRALECKGDLHGAIQKYSLAHHFNKDDARANRYLRTASLELRHTNSRPDFPLVDVVLKGRKTHELTVVANTTDNESDRCPGENPARLSNGFRLILARR
ncbi:MULTISPECIES: tetratricopeptide repeat protein [Paraburkholderia]|uniref:tetratricopeptide repeat protein n=1 Tax=Paraburkholderia TaxID=1822464 RepID=UPI0020B7BCBF|nr:tetratricopeptide repeat protein [Paraburkholderia sp. CNPSo 3281]MCP3720807.1 tetratricopeptide repeat protein [Paraburkholderia sp. CNPSo 3281]